MQGSTEGDKEGNNGEGCRRNEEDRKKRSTRKSRGSGGGDREGNEEV